MTTKAHPPTAPPTTAPVFEDDGLLFDVMVVPRGDREEPLVESTAEAEDVRAVFGTAVPEETIAEEAIGEGVGEMSEEDPIDDVVDEVTGVEGGEEDVPVELGCRPVEDDTRRDSEEELERKLGTGSSSDSSTVYMT